MQHIRDRRATIKCLQAECRDFSFTRFDVGGLILLLVQILPHR